MINTKLPMRFNLQGLMLLLSQQLCAAGRPDAAGEADSLAAKLGPVEIYFELLTIDVLCRACDEMRKRGDAEAVAAIEALVVTLKAGKKRKIVGGLNYNVSSKGEIYDAAEKLVKHAERQADRLAGG